MILEANQPHPGSQAALDAAASGSDTPLGTDANPIGGGAKAKAAAKGRKRESRGKKQRQARAALRAEGLEPPKRDRQIAWEAIKNARGPVTTGPVELPKRPILIPKEEQERRAAEQPAESMDIILEMKAVLKGEFVPPDATEPLSVSAEVRRTINEFRTTGDVSVAIRQEYVRKCQNLWPMWQKTLSANYEWAPLTELDQRMGTRTLLVLPQFVGGDATTDEYLSSVRATEMWAQNHSNPESRTPQERFDDDFVDFQRGNLCFSVSP